MLVVCPGCAARYRIGGDRVPLQGARARCPKCERVFRVGLPPDQERVANPAAPAPLVGAEEPRGGPAATEGPANVPSSEGGKASQDPASPASWGLHLAGRHLASPSGDEEGPTRGTPAGAAEEGTAQGPTAPSIDHEQAAEDGAARESAAGKGAAKEGAAKEGAAKEGAAKEGAAKEGTAEDSPALEGEGAKGPALKDPAHGDMFSRPGLRRDSTTIGDERLRARLAERVRQTRREGGNLPLLVTHGYGVDDEPSRLESISAPGAGPPPELLALSDTDMATIAEDIVSALVATHADEVARARDDERWDAHLGPLIREAWSDFQACVGSGPATDRHFRNALNRILAQGRDVF